ncbi:MAG: hypothetical protein R3F30_11650 [Planctomycetota bacterium]
MREVVGLQTLEPVLLTLRAEGERLIGDWSLGVDPEAKRSLASCLLAKDASFDKCYAVPYAENDWIILPLDPARTIRYAFQAFRHPICPGNIRLPDLVGTFKQKTGVDVFEELLPELAGPVWIVFPPGGPPVDAKGVLANVSGCCVGIGLTRPDRFAGLLARTLTAAGLDESSEIVKHRGRELRTLDVPSVGRVSWTVFEGGLLVGFGQASTERLQACLDGVAEDMSGPRDPALTRHVATLLTSSGLEPVGLGAFPPSKHMINYLIGGLEGGLEGGGSYGPLLASVQRFRKRLGNDASTAIRERGLDRVDCVWGWVDGRLVLRQIW